MNKQEGRFARALRLMSKGEIDVVDRVMFSLVTGGDLTVGQVRLLVLDELIARTEEGCDDDV